MKFLGLRFLVLLGMSISLNAQTNLPVRPTRFSFWSGGLAGIVDDQFFLGHVFVDVMGVLTFGYFSLSGFPASE